MGVREVLRRVMGKVVMSVFSEDVTTTSSDSQMCGQIQVVREKYV